MLGRNTLHRIRGLDNPARLRAHGLEGSRFYALQHLAAGAELTPKETRPTMLAGGSRELPSAMFRPTLRSFVLSATDIHFGALGYSREPLLNTFLSLPHDVANLPAASAHAKAACPT